MPIVLITGATSGIGKATAYLLAQNNYSLILTGRRNERLQAIKTDLTTQYPDIRVLTLAFDVRSYEQVKSFLDDTLPAEWKDIQVIINNAGGAVGFGPIDKGNPEDWDTMIDTNVKGLLYVTKVASKQMLEKKDGHIINVASIAGKEVYLNGNVYCAAKHAADALSKAMRIDLLPYHIKVTNIAPGMVDTDFSLVRYKGDKEKADAIYANMEPLHDVDIAEAILFAMNRPKHVNINDMVIMPTAQANTSHLIREEN